jgi:hypothetical protein
LADDPQVADLLVGHVGVEDGRDLGGKLSSGTNFSSATAWHCFRRVNPSRVQRVELVPHAF